MYIKALEAEVLRLKEVYADACRERDASAQERDALLVEIQRLKDLLSAHGIAYDSPQLQQNYAPKSESAYGSSSASHAGSSYNPGTASTGFTSPPHTTGGSISSPPSQPQSSVNQRLDYNQIGTSYRM